METSMSFNTWMSLSDQEISHLVWPHQLSIMFTSDGTRRHYLMHHPEEGGRISNYRVYQQHCAEIYSRSFSMLYRFGIQTIMTPGLYSLNFLRGAEMLQFFLQATRQSLLHEPFLSLYQDWDIKVRLYGDYDIAPAADPIRGGLLAVDADLAALHPDGSRLLLFGYTADAFENEYLRRAALLQQKSGTPPSTDAIRRACFPHGPDHLDIHLGGGWMRVGRVLPFALDTGTTDLYFCTGLTFDLTEEMLRRILYDHLYLRRTAPEDNASYDEAEIAILRDYYALQGQNVIGLGHVIGQGLWYAR